MAMSDHLGPQFHHPKHAGPNYEPPVKPGVVHQTQGEARIAAGRILPGKHARKENQ